MGSSEDAGTVQPLQPAILGRYALYDKIAAGGMATVHIGRLLGPVGFARTVAVKRLHAQYAGDPEFVSMFLDEARLAARIHHPNVVATVDVVATSGELLLVMEYVRGESLARLFALARRAGTRIPPELSATMMAGVLHGLHAAHEARGDRGEPLGIVHRDVSPQNVLVGVDGVARVVDFGVAMAAGRIQTTRDGQVKGKLRYMAPEQLRGSVERTTDVYAASIVLWETLTGARLFDGANDAEVFTKLMDRRVDAPSRVAPGLSAALDAIVLRGLSADPAERFPTAREMARAIEDAVPPVAASRIGEWVEATAQDALRQRAMLVEFVESDSSTRAPPGSVPPPGGVRLATTLSSRASRGRAAPIAIAENDPTEDAVHTQLSSGSISAPHDIVGQARRRSRVILGSAGLGAIAVLVLGMALVRASRSNAADRAGTGSVPAASGVPVWSGVPPVASTTGAPPGTESSSSLPALGLSAISDPPATSPSSSSSPSSRAATASPSRRIVGGPARAPKPAAPNPYSGM